MDFQIKIDKLLALIICFLIPLVSLNNNITFGIFGLLPLLCLLILATIIYLFFQLKNNFKPKIKISLFVFYVFFFIFLCIYIIAFLRFPTISGFINVVQVILLFFFTLFISNTNWSEYYLKLLGNFITSFVILLFVFWIAQGFPQGFTAYMTNPNALGAYLFSISFFLLTRVIIEDNKKKRKFYIGILLMTLVLIFSTHSRSVLISLLIILIVYLLWDIFLRSKIIYYSLFLFVIILIFCTIYYYPRLNEMPTIFSLFNSISHFFGKELYSGRELIWKAIIDATEGYRIFGLGTKANTLTMLGLTLSAHNLYLQIFMQVGLIGILILILIFLKLWSNYRVVYIFLTNQKLKKVTKLSASFLLGIMLHQMFEVTLTQNNLSIGVIQWFIIVLPISFMNLFNNSD